MILENLAFEAGRNKLYGTLTLPDAPAIAPCVVMVHGSGAQDRDGNISGFDTQIFKIIAEYLARQGIASFRYDKRGCGISEGDFKVAGLSEMVDDAGSAIAFVKSQVRVNSEQVFVLGHSEGAVLAPEISNKNKLAGVIMLCASVRSFEEDGVKNAEVLNRDLDQLSGLKGLLARKLFYTKEPLKMMQSLRARVEKTKSKRMWVSFTRVSTKFYRDTFNYDVKQHLADTQASILAIGGEKDFQCHPDDTMAIASLTDATVQAFIIKDMDHTLRLQSQSPSIMTYQKSTKEPVVESVLEHIAEWLNVQCQPIEQNDIEPFVREG